MDSLLLSELQETLPNGLNIPSELKTLYNWIESNGLYYKNREGQHIGYLFPPSKINDTKTDSFRVGGTEIYFSVVFQYDVKKWLGLKEPCMEVDERIKIFGRTGGEGSMCALWKSDIDEKVKIVNLGSGSGSTTVCVYAENGLDFLRLIAIGYDEIADAYSFQFTANVDAHDYYVKPNKDYMDWVESTFNVDIPLKGSEIVKNVSDMGDKKSNDEFFNWCERIKKNCK